VMGVELLLPEISWGSHLAGLQTGANDIAAGATYSVGHCFPAQRVGVWVVRSNARSAVIAGSAGNGGNN
jgi:hypothetical protein